MEFRVQKVDDGKVTKKLRSIVREKCLVKRRTGGFMSQYFSVS